MANNNNAVPNPDYQPTTWEQGMIITAKDLNDMEEQIDELVEAVPEIVKVSNTTPNSPYNQVWVKKGEPITLAQMDDFNTFCDSFAPTYTKGNNYEIGDYVIYNTILYKCKQKVTNAPKQLNQNAWSKVYLIDDITNLIKVQDTQPTSQLNKLWLTSTPDQGVTLATYQDFINMVAEEYSTTKLYKAGDYVIHDGHLYRRLNDASNSENWVSNNWTAVTVSEEAQDMSINYNSMMASIATEYNPTKTYNVGDYCKHNSKLYQCNISIGTAEAWTAEHWTEVAFSEELSNLKTLFKGNYESFINTFSNLVMIPNAGNVYYYEEDNPTHRYCGSFGNLVVFDYVLTTASQNNRIPYTGTATKLSTASPNYNARPDWFVDDIPDFIVGHEYYFGVKLLSGEIGDGGLVKSFGLMTKDGSLNVGVPIEGTWVCNIKPQNVYINLAPGTYTQCIWYCYIVDKTLEAEYDVRYDVAQSLTDSQKEQARMNIDSASAQEASELKSAIKAENDFVNDLYGYVNYDYNLSYDQPSMNTASGGQLAVKRDLTTIILNTNAAQTGNIWTKLNGDLARNTGGSQVKQWDSIRLKTGHNYEFKLKYISGTSTLNDVFHLPDAVVYVGGVAGAIGTYKEGDTEYSRYFTAEEGKTYAFGIFTDVGMIFQDGQFQVTLADLTVQAKKENEQKNESADRLSSVMLKNVDVAKIENALTEAPLNKLIVELPIIASSTETPMPNNVVTYTSHNSVSVHFGNVYGTPITTKNIVLSQEWEALYCGSIDFANGKIYKKYDWLLLDGVTDGLKFVEASNGNYVITNTKLKTSVNSFRCFSTWLPAAVLRVNAGKGFIYGYPADYDAIGIESVDSLNAQVAANPLLILFELAIPEEHSFDTTGIYTDNSYAWPSEGTLTIEYAASFTNATEVLVENERTRLHRANTLSSLPAYKIPTALYYNKTPYFYDIIGNPYSYGTYYRTNGITYDGVRYIYYALGAGDYYALRKVDTWTKKVVATGAVANHGHWETLAFVPNWVPGFDNGTVDRIYETTLDAHGTVKVFDANTLELISSFQTDSLISSPYYTKIHRLLFNQNHGKFVLSSDTAIIDNKKYFTFTIADMNGHLEKCVRLEDVGTGCGFDSDDNFIYMLKDISGEVDRMLVLDWNLSPVTMATFTHEDYEPEGLYHIGDTFYMLCNIENRMGVHIWEYACVNEFSDTKPTFPMSGWVSSLIDPNSFGDIAIS